MASESQQHTFGGDWTETKLTIVGKYLAAYTKALRNQPFKKGYIDAFAGSGYRSERGAPDEDGDMFADLREKEPKSLRDGSARIALKTDPPFDSYVFLETDPSRFEQLEALKSEFPHLADRISTHQADANEHLQKIYRLDWSAHRAVVFLDPYGMQVDWATIAAVARTRSIDLWILFPLGQAVNRMLPRHGELPKGWQDRLDRFLGTPEWRDRLYKRRKETDLSGETETVEKASIEAIGEFFIERLASVFAGVADKPAILRNSTGCPPYLLCFACGNPRAKGPALGIADYILGKLR